MKKVIIESPYEGDVRKNCAYARACMLDSLKRGEAPFLSHILYTLVLNDRIEDERNLGIDAGLTWGESAELTVVYSDFGISKGMHIGINDAKMMKRPIEYRSLPHFENGLIYEKLVDNTVEIDLAQWRGGNIIFSSIFFLHAILQNWKRSEIRKVEDQVNHLSLIAQFKILRLYTKPILPESAYRNMIDVRFVLGQLKIKGSELEMTDMDEWKDAQWDEWRMIRSEMRKYFIECYGLFPDWVKPEEKYEYDPLRLTSLPTKALEIQQSAEFVGYHIYMRWFPMSEVNTSTSQNETTTS